MSLYKHKYPQQLFRKQLWVTKVNHTSPRQKELNKAIHSLFYNPSTFFETSYDGKEVVVGRKNPTVHSLIQFTQSTPKNPRRSIFQGSSRRTTLKRMNSNSFLSRSSMSTRGIQTCTKELGPNQQYVDESDLKKIYDDYRSIKKQNLTASNSNINLLKNTDPKIKNELSQIFDQQEKSLKNFSLELKGSNKIMKCIAQRLNKKPNDLLMSKIDNFRIKKEMVNQCEEEIKNNSPLPVNQWGLTLRQSPERNSKYYINVGSPNKPKWHLFVQRPKPLKEIIRHPNMSKDNIDKKEITNYINNVYLKTKLHKRSFSQLQESANADSLNSLEIKGMDLLQFEQENSKMLRGKKILSSPECNKELRKSLVFGKDVNLPLLLKSKKNKNVNK